MRKKRGYMGTHLGAHPAPNGAVVRASDEEVAPAAHCQAPHLAVVAPELQKKLKPVVAK